MTLDLPYPPSANRYWRTFRGIVTVSSEAKAYKTAVGLLCRGRKVALLDGPVSVTVDVYRPQRSGDLDNTLKVLLDSLRGHAYADDKQVVDIRARRHDDKLNPRAVVTVEAAP